MSFNVAATSIATGLGLTVYGSYKYIIAIQKPTNEISQQKKIGLELVAAGVAAIAMGAGIIYSGEATSTVEDELRKNPEFMLRALNPEATSKVEEVAGCPIDALKDILKAGEPDYSGGSDSITAKTFKVFEDTQGISCDNYLPWQNEFHRGGTGYIDGIHTKHLQKPAMWGIDQWKRPYIAIKYVCDQTKEGAVALFQRYTNSGSTLASGGHFQPEGCYLGPLNPLNSDAKKFLGNLTSFFKGENVVFPKRWVDNISILTLAK
jgi:hypothetical protein